MESKEQEKVEEEPKKKAGPSKTSKRREEMKKKYGSQSHEKHNEEVNEIGNQI